MRWLITNRNLEGAGFGGSFAPLTFWTYDNAGGAADIRLRTSWTQRTFEEFRLALIAAAARFPIPVTTPTEDQRHITLFVHGYNNSWEDAATSYDEIARTLFDHPATSLAS